MISDLDLDMKYDLMEDNIQKNIRELAELCVDYEIYSVDDLTDLIENYCNILEQARKNGGNINLKVDEEV